MTSGAESQADRPADEDSSHPDPRDLKLWRRRAENDSDAERTDANLIALVSANGEIHSVLNKPAADSALPDGIARGTQITALWPGEPGERIRRSLKKAVQSRQAFTGHFDSDGCSVEFIVVPQGRDRVMLIARDASQSTAELEQLSDLAYMDPETGLPNRKWLLDELRAIVHRVRLRQGRGALLCLDIEQEDDFRQMHGQEAWRIVLANVASRLTRALRGANRPEDDDERYSVVARIDETRFAVVLPEIETGEDASAVARRLAELLQAPMVIDAREHSLKIPIGIALYPQDGERASELLENGLVALQEARFSLTSVHKFHSGTTRMRALERQDLVVELENALKNEEFELHYLPALSATFDRVAAVEVLLRWPRPLFASRPIQEVIKAAEHTGLIVPIGEWVLATALNDLADWRRHKHPELRLAFNASGPEFSREDFAERIERICGENGLEPSCIDLEITEHLLLRDALRGFPSCQSLRKAGVRIVVDDYGTGICSFDYLSGSPVAGVKIHQKFTALADHNPSSRAACAAITAMAHELGMLVTAEGVETAEQAEALARIGCDQMQGFYFSKPAMRDAISAYLDGISPGTESDGKA